jgi:signal transduction histidine kinase
VHSLVTLALETAGLPSSAGLFRGPLPRAASAGPAGGPSLKAMAEAARLASGLREAAAQVHRLRWPLTVAGVRIIGLGAVVYLVAASHRGAGASGRSPWVIVLLTASGVAWTGWASYTLHANIRERVPPMLLASVLVLITGGGLLVGLSHSGYAEAFPSAGVFIAGFYLRARWSMPATCTAVVAVLAGTLVWSAPTGGLTQALVIPVGVWFGSLIRRQRALRLEEEAKSAALAERARIARELHDVLAHSLAGLSVQLEAARALLASGADAQIALEHVERAHRLSAEGLAEARRAVAALREDSPPLTERLRDLASRHGQGATFAARGTERRLAPETELALFRAAQEALTNVSRHAPGAPVEVQLDYGAKEVALVVANRAVRETVSAFPAEARRAGYGLVGMRERAALAGGTFSAGPSGEGWRVEMRVPA